MNWIFTLKKIPALGILVWTLLLLSGPALSQEKFLTSRHVPGYARDWNLEGSAKGTAKLIAASQKIKGDLPLLIEYSFKQGVNDFIFLEKTIPVRGIPKKIKMMLYGDKSGNSFRINFIDGEGEIFQASISQIDWDGWKEIVTSLNFSVHWGGEQ